MPAIFGFFYGYRGRLRARSLAAGPSLPPIIENPPPPKLTASIATSSTPPATATSSAQRATVSSSTIATTSPATDPTTFPSSSTAIAPTSIPSVAPPPPPPTTVVSSPFVPQPSASISKTESARSSPASNSLAASIAISNSNPPGISSLPASSSTATTNVYSLSSGSTSPAVSFSPPFFPSNPTFAPTPTAVAASPQKPSDRHVKTIAGVCGGVGGFLIVILLALLAYSSSRRRRRRVEDRWTNDTYDPGEEIRRLSGIPDLSPSPASGNFFLSAKETGDFSEMTTTIRQPSPKTPSPLPIRNFARPQSAPSTAQNQLYGHYRQSSLPGQRVPEQMWPPQWPLRRDLETSHDDAFLSPVAPILRRPSVRRDTGQSEQDLPGNLDLLNRWLEQNRRRSMMGGLSPSPVPSPEPP